MAQRNVDNDDSKAEELLAQESMTETHSHMNKENTFLQHFFPYGFSNEARILLKITVPFVFGSILSSWLIGFIALAMIGHARGQLELNASALALSTYILIGNSLILGLNFGCDTLLPQCHGGNKRKMGLIVQRAFIIILFSCFISWTLLLNAKYALKLIEPDQHVVILADQFLRWLILIVPFDGLSMLLQKYIASNEKTMPLLIINGLGNCINAALNYLFLYQFDLGIRSLPLAMTISYAFNSILALIYIRLSTIYKETWHPINRACLQEWDVYLKLSAPGVLMVMTEFWSIEQSIFMAARLGSRSLSAQICSHQTTWLFYLVTSSFATAANIRIGQYLGAGKPQHAANTKNVTYALGALIILFNICLITIGHYWFPLAYNTEKDALTLARRVLLLIALLQIWDGYNIINTGIVKACGQQMRSAFISLVGFYLCGFPLAVFLMFFIRIDIYGFWLGIMFAETVTNVLLCYTIKRFNWQRHSQKALKRIAFHSDKPNSECNVLEDNKLEEDILQTNFTQNKQESSLSDLFVKKLIVLALFISVFCFGLWTSIVIPLYK